MQWTLKLFRAMCAVFLMAMIPLSPAFAAALVQLGYAKPITATENAVLLPPLSAEGSKMLNIKHIYTMKYTGDLDYTFPNIPVLGNSLIYVFSFMGESVVTTETHYNNGLGPHDLDFGYLVSSGHTLSPALTGANGATVEIIWTQCIQDAAFNTVHFKAKEAVSLLNVVTYLTIYEIEGAIGQTPGIGTSTNFNPTLDWREGSTTTADATLIALGSHMELEPNTNDCSCPPPGNCGANDHQAKFTLGANFGTVIGQAAIPGFDLFNVTDPCNPAYVSSDFIFAVNSNGSANAQTLTDNIRGNWIIDYQIDGQIFGHIGSTVSGGSGTSFVSSEVVAAPTDACGTDPRIASRQFLFGLPGKSVPFSQANIYSINRRTGLRGDGSTGGVLTILYTGTLAGDLSEVLIQDAPDESVNGLFSIPTTAAWGSDGVHSLLQFKQDGADLTVFGGLISSLTGMLSVAMTVPDVQDDDGIGFDTTYQPWFAQLDMKTLRFGGYRGQLEGAGQIDVTPVAEDSTLQFQTLSLEMHSGTVQFEGGMLFDGSYCSTRISNGARAGSWFSVKLHKMYAALLFEAQP